MSLLTDDEIEALQLSFVTKSDVRDIEAAILAKLASAELPEWSKRDDLGGLVPSEIRQALRRAEAQGAASQLAQRDALQAENERLKAERDRNLDSIRVNNEIISKKNAEIDALAAKLVPLTDKQIVAAYEDYCGYARGFFETDALHDLLDGRAHSGVSDFIAGCKAAIDAAKGGQHEDKN